jgi:ABC-type branched-subunit amino acid transport system substrate-binding protein
MKRNVAFVAFVLALVAVLAVGLASCGGETETTQTTGAATTATPGSTDVTPTTATPTTGGESTETTAATPGEQKTLKIGGILALTMAQGIEVQKWMNLMAKTINEQGGWKIGNDTYTIEYTAYDCGYNDPNKTRSAVEKAVLQDGIKLLVANWGDTTQITGTITEPNKVLALGLDLTGDLLKPDVKYFFNASGIFFNAGMNFHLFAYYKEKGATDHLTVGLDNPMIKMVVQTQNAAAAASGLKVLDPLYYTQDTVDFGPLATKIMALNPTFVNVGTTVGDTLVNLLTALHDSGYKGLISPGFMDEVTLDKMAAKYGKEWFEGMATTGTDPRGVQDDPRMTALMESYTAEYGTFSADGIRWFTPWFFFEDAVNATQSVDPDVLAEYLAKSTKAVMGLCGYGQLVARPELQSDRTVEAVLPDLFGVIRDGKLVVEQRVPIKDQYLASIKSYNMLAAYQPYWEKNGKPQFPDEASMLDYADLAQ